MFRSDNKRLGTEFEREFCAMLAKDGYWVHFIVPDARGAQPFDVVAVKKGVAYAFDCKTSARRVFPLSRLEYNQKTAFELWMRCGNLEPFVAVKFESRIYLLPYLLLRQKGKLELTEVFEWSV